MSTSCKRNKLFINSVLPIGGKVESDQKNNVTGEYFLLQCEVIMSKKRLIWPLLCRICWHFLKCPLVLRISLLVLKNIPLIRLKINFSSLFCHVISSVRLYNVYTKWTCDYCVLHVMHKSFLHINKIFIQFTGNAIVSMCISSFSFYKPLDS